MSSEATPKKNFKQKLKKELIEYWINVAYLAVFFAVFISYKRLILAEHGIVYTDWGAGIIKALVLGKVVSVGAIMKLGRRAEQRPVYITALYKSVMFTLWLTVFNAVEVLVRGLIQTGTYDGMLHHLSVIGSPDYFGGMLVVFTAFIPFFLVKELGGVLGVRRLQDLIFGPRPAQTKNGILE